MLLHFLSADTVSGVGFGGSKLALVHGAEHGPDLELALGRATGGWLRLAIGVEKIGWVLAHTYGKVDSSVLRQSEVLNHWLRGGPNYSQQLKRYFRASGSRRSREGPAHSAQRYHHPHRLTMAVRQ